MQTWDFESFSIGYPTNYFEHYAQTIAEWKKLGDLEYCDPSVVVKQGNEYDLAGRFQTYFLPSSDQALGYGDQKKFGYVTSMLADAAGFRLEFTLKPRLLRIQPGQWDEAAALPDTNPNEYLFWFCPTTWSPGHGGCLVANMGKDGMKSFRYAGGQRAVLLSPGVPHVLSEIKTPSNHSNPYYCLYGQLVEATKDL